METIRCIFCNKDANKTIIEENGYKGRKCSTCGLIYISPRPSFSNIQNLYIHSQAHISAESHISSSFVKRLYAKHNIQIIKKFVKDGSMLEIGAGAGYFLDEARKEGFDVYGIEFNTVQADFIRSKLGIPCEKSSLNSTLFNGKKFNIIYHCDVISHFHNPIAEFRKINDKLKDKGLLIFETGNIPDMREKYLKSFTTFQYPDHLFFFGENNLKELLRRTGFEFIAISKYSILPQLIIRKVFAKAINFVKLNGKTGRQRKASSPNTSKSSISKINFKQLIKSTHEHFFGLIHGIMGYATYLIRYKIGYVLPKKGRPQTVIVIARKKT